MHVHIVHLSDFHFNEKNIMNHNSKINDLITTIDSFLDDEDVVLIIVSGDIANHGKRNEYKMASRYFYKLENDLKEKNPKICVFMYFVPGNHDCDFWGIDDEIRSEAVNAVKADNYDDNTFDDLAKVQKEFNVFSLKVGSASNFGRLNRQAFVQLLNGEVQITINLINTAWMSERIESKKIIMPVNKLKLDKFLGYSKLNPKFELTLTAYHHPAAWFTSESDCDFRQKVEAISDIVLSGHEHTDEGYKKVGNKYSTLYSCAGEMDSSEPQFKVYSINLVNREGVVRTIKYRVESRTFGVLDSKTFVIEKKREFMIDEIFENYLSDLGMVLSHRKKEKLFFEDLFVMPNLSYAKEGKTEIIVRDSEVLFELSSQNRIFLTADSGFGKTSLLKKLFTYFYSQNYVPLLFSGKDFESKSEKRINKEITKKVLEQYGENAVLAFNTLTKKSKIAIVDDFHLIRNNLELKEKVLSILEENFEKVIITASSLANVSLDINSFNLLVSYRKYTIEPFSLRLIRNLCRNWKSAGDNDYTDTEVDNYVNHVSDTVSSLLKDNFMPATPSTILMLLSAIDSQLVNAQDRNLYGNLLQMVITNSMYKTGIEQQDIDQNFELLYQFAYALYKRNVKKTSYAIIAEIVRVYNEAVLDNRNSKDFLNQCVAANILRETKTEQGVIESVGFRYTYLYSFFLAGYISKHFDEDEVQEIIHDLLMNIHIDSNAQIFINIWYFSSRKELFDLLIRRIAVVFQNVNLYKFEEPASCIKAINDRKKDIVFQIKNFDDDVEKHREEHLDDLEKLEYQDKKKYDSYNEEDETKEDEALNQVVTALNLLRSLGQITKSSSGTIMAEQKKSIIKSAYKIGMQTLSFMFSMIDDAQDSFIKVARRIREENKDKISIEEAYQATMLKFSNLLQCTSYAIIMQISHSVANDKMKLALKKVIEEEQTIAYKLIEIGAYYGVLREEIPEKVLVLAPELENDLFSYTILRSIVYQYYYLNKTNDLPMRDRIIKKLGFNPSSPNLHKARK